MNCDTTAHTSVVRTTPGFVCNFMGCRYRPPQQGVVVVPTPSPMRGTYHCHTDENDIPWCSFCYNRDFGTFPGRGLWTILGMTDCWPVYEGAPPLYICFDCRGHFMTDIASETEVVDQIKGGTGLPSELAGLVGGFVRC